MIHHEHCQTCGAHFDSHGDLLTHVQAQHAETGRETQAPPQVDNLAEEEPAPQPRKDREFTRSHRE